jgi:anti-anti-sigma regulatory factor
VKAAEVPDRMLKIESAKSTDGCPRLTLEGRVIGPWVGEVRDACEQALAAGFGLTLDLSEVVFVDKRGLELLRALGQRGVRLDCSAFVAEQLKAPPCR